MNSEQRYSSALWKIDTVSAFQPAFHRRFLDPSQDRTMDVDPPTAFAYLEAFARFERDLKRWPQFIKGQAGKPAEVNWRQVNRALTALPAEAFIDQVPRPIRQRILGGRRDRPRVQQVQLRPGGERFVKFKSQPLPPNDAVALLIAAKRVRNNLFHGGKEEPDASNQEWVLAGLAIVQLLLALDWRRLGIALDQGA